jgi:hypothetical protein
MSTETLEQIATEPVETNANDTTPSQPVEKQDTGETSESAETNEPEAAEGEEKEKPFVELRKHARELERSVKRIARENAELREMVKKTIPAEQPPVREQFADEAQFIQATVQHELRKVQAQQPSSNPIAAKFDEAKRNYKDFDEKMRDIDHVRFPTGIVQNVIASLPYGSDVLYRLASNPEEAEEVAALPPEAIAARLGEMHADIRREKTKIKKASSAPKPPPKIGQRGAVKIDLSKLSDKEYLVYKRQERFNKLKERLG